MKQWMKYIAVVCCFFMMVVLFFPYSGSNMVRASEGGTVSGGDIAVAPEEGEDETGTEPWTVTINIKVDGTIRETISPIVSGETFCISTANVSAPTKDGYTFKGWLCSVEGEKNEYGLSGTLLENGKETDFVYTCTDYTGAIITLTAQWTWNGSKITEGGTYTLNAGEEYQLGTGTWTVNDDTSSYSGGIKFYVNGGSYTFNSN